MALPDCGPHSHRGHMSSAAHRKPVIVGLDGSKSDAISVGVAAGEAVRRGTSLLAVHAWMITDDHLPLQGGVRIDPSIEVRLGQELQRTVEHLVAQSGPEDLQTRVQYGYAGDVLCRLSEQSELLVLAGHGKGAWRGLLLGSVSQYVVERASCPVMVVHGVAAGTGGRVVVGVDGSPSSLAALCWADRLACTRRTGLTAVHAGGPMLERALYPEPTPHNVLGPWEEKVRGTMARWLEDALPRGRSRAVEVVVNPRSAAVVLLEQADEHDVLVVGRRGTGGFPGLHLGSVARRVIAQAPGAAVVVPPGWTDAPTRTTPA